MNYFGSKSVAERYAKHRPNFHPLVVEKIKAYLNLERPLQVALDVGCGPGQFTVALKEIAKIVIGMDISAEMLGAADKTTGIPYIQTPAEWLPIKGNSSDLLTTSLAFHWFDPKRFFAEARRVLREDAWLIISNNGFSGQMLGNDEFAEWVTQVYDRRYPSPPRNSSPMTPEVSQEHGFRFAHEEDYQNGVPFTIEELAAYLVTQSNVIAATQGGKERVEDIFRWILAQTRPLFKTERPVFAFRGYIWYLQKVP